MTLMTRIRLIWNARAARLLDEAEQPPEILDYAYSRQLEMLAALKRGLVDVAASRHELQREIDAVGERAAALDGKAAGAVQKGREDLAALLLERKHRALAELPGMRRHLEELSADEARLVTSHQELSSRVEEFRLHRVAVSARYSAATAQVGIAESLAGVGGDLAELSLAVGRAEERTARMLSRAAALDALLHGGAFELGGPGDSVDAELRRLDVEAAVADDLARLRTAPATAEEK